MMKNKVEYDVIIIGGGPAGLTAGIYCGRSGLKTLLLEEDMIGGMANRSYHIGNYPGFPKGINGLDLMNKFYNQAKEAQVEFKYESVTTMGQELGMNIVRTKNGIYQSYGMIIATGGNPKKIGALNENDFIGKGISFCTLCDAPETRNKTVLVIGTGDTAVDQSIYLSNFSDDIVISSLNNEGNYDCIDQKKLSLISDHKIKIMWNSEVISFHGEQYLSKVTLRDKNTQELFDFPCNYCFEFIGFTPNSTICLDVVDTDEQGAILTNEQMETSCPGIYAIGDVRKKTIKQLTTATADGAIASYMVKKYVDKLTKIN